MELEISAATLPELFEKVACGLAAAFPGESSGEALREKLAVEASTLSELLQAWTGAILTAYYVNRQRLSRFEILSLDPAHGACRVQADAWGELTDPIAQPPFKISSCVVQGPDPKWSGKIELRHFPPP